ncbi:flagellar biosynthesis protein FlhF [Moritella marina ATCC 15381]|uniref:Flagellar biosynthesis protein FlhF n=1 Tax=Moritella marina ATCC 15381 TaxID=1202962 RepID=A0A5J6WHL2_MORMI|nr:flagellar biosynthesis protein FlhF [Moritella marina]QFI36678.1 flagellar biosynthesis protein FlhF [Moritella marina ATCC 15381]
MKIKRFFAKDMRAALAEVKEVLGPDAVIMSNKKVTGGIEIVAAVDFSESKPAAPEPAVENTPAKNKTNRQLSEDSVNLSASKFSFKKLMTSEISQQAEPEKVAEPTDSLASLLARQQEHKQQMSQAIGNEESGSEESNWDTSFLKKPVARRFAEPPKSAPATLAEQNEMRDGMVKKPLQNGYKPFESSSPKIDNQQDISAMKAELASIRQLLEHQVSGLQWQEVERNEPIRAMLIKHLVKIGFTEEIADQLVNCVAENCSIESAWDQIQALLIDNVLIAQDDILSKGGAVALVGPTGVGKTTTIAKLAAKFAMLHGSDNVALITTDTYRIGAHEQLATYGRIMGCTVKVARDDAELAQYLYQLRSKRLVLIDTAGMGQRDTRLSEQLKTLVNNEKVVIRNYLVVPATAQRRVVQETLEHFHHIPLSGCILSKVDESLSLGEILSVLIQHQLPIAYITNGQRVPEDIDSANAQQLVRTVLDRDTLEEQNDTHFWLGDDK